MSFIPYNNSKPSILLDGHSCPDWCNELIAEVNSIKDVAEQKVFKENNRVRLLKCEEYQCTPPTSLAGGRQILR